MRTAQRMERSGIGWGELLRTAALGDFLVVGAAAAVLQDLEGAALTIGLLVAALLLRLRSGLLGRLALAGLFANIAFWAYHLICAIPVHTRAGMEGTLRVT